MIDFPTKGLQDRQVHLKLFALVINFHKLRYVIIQSLQSIINYLNLSNLLAFNDA